MPADLDHRPRADATPVILRLTPGPIVLRTVGATGLGAIPLHRLPRSVHIASVLAPAALTTGILVRAQRRAVAEPREGADSAAPAPDKEPVPHQDAIAPTDRATPRARAGIRWMPVLMLSGTMGVALAGATYAGIQIDRAIENALRRRKVPAPRLVMGLASGALSLGMDLLEDRVPTADSSSTDR